jgi:nucleotide-binding universal stress UspA family protein
MSAREAARVVAAVDGERDNAGALAYAVAEAVRHGDSLHLAHVWSGERHGEGSAVIRTAEATARSLAPDLRVSTELVVGPRAAGILAAARGGRLLVVGRSSHHRVDGAFGGTPAVLAARAECPIVVVPAAWIAGADAGRILVGMKSRTHSRELLSHAFEIAHERGASVVVITAWELYDPTMDLSETKDHGSEWVAEGVTVLEELVGEWRARFPTVPVELIVSHGHAAVVLEKASVDADLLLVGRRQRSVPPYGRLGGTSHALLQASRCPVEVVPAGVVAPVPDSSSVASTRA